MFRDRRRRTPWSKILHCSKIRALFVLLCCNGWNLNYFRYYGPLYFKRITSSTNSGAFWLTSAAFLTRMVLGILCLPLLRYIIIQNRMSVTVLRKSIAFIAQVIPGTIALTTIAVHCKESVNIVIGLLILGFNGAFIGSGFINALDLAPHFAQALFAPMQALICVITAVMPFMVAYISELVKEKVYVNVMMIGLVYVVGGLTFITFGSATVQPWDIAEARRMVQSSISVTHLGYELDREADDDEQNSGLC
ncbi:hypothetical protein PPYR_06513 [Photinus pyralis]|uniref:Major facilitator superfamily (MFS) profile domain-containing protein n=2 Tax=Photinus pyralis TaxID=7054 RepID=A0A5N4ATV7_PHOPY|nr:hypothetical protein PPYR_06513 [Photinus pyralis]